MSLKSAFLKGCYALIAVVCIWSFAFMMLPYGNHLAAIYFSQEKPGNVFEKLFFSSFSRVFSYLYVDYFAIECESKILMLNAGSGFYYEHLGVGEWIYAYENNLAKSSHGANPRGRKVISEMIEACPPDGVNSSPPLSAAIFIKDIGFVKALLERGADPNHGYVSASGKAITPLVVADRLMEVAQKNSDGQAIKQYGVIIKAMLREIDMRKPDGRDDEFGARSR